MMIRVLGFSVLGLLVAGCNPFESKLVKVCEVTLLHRLRSPAGYDRIEATQSVSEMSLSLFEWRMLKEIEQAPPDSRKQKREALAASLEGMKTSSRMPKRFVVHIRYDAPNVYGTPIRSVSVCEYLSASGDLSDASGLNVRVDGFTASEAVMERLGAAAKTVAQ